MKKFLIILSVLLICVCIGVLVMIGYRYILEKLPNFERASLAEIIPNIEAETMSVIIEDEPVLLDYYPKMVDGQIYLPVDLVNLYIDPYFYWDENEKTLTYTTKNNVIRMNSEELTYFVNSKPLQLDIPISTFDTATAYIPISLILDFCNVSFVYNEALDLLILDYTDKEYTVAEVDKEKAYIRLDSNEKSKIVEKMVRNDELKLYEDLANGWSRIRTSTGLIGYIKQEDIIKKRVIYPNIKKELEETEYNEKSNIEGKINIAWHQVTNMQANSYVEKVFEDVHNLDVISPTWFALKNSEGEISNIADKEYVSWAHKQGYQVLALFSNSFSSSITHDVLRSTEKREEVIKQILALASIYDLD